MKMQGKTAEQKQDSAKQDSVNQDSKHKLDNRYGKIGISAVAAAANYVGEQQTGSQFYRIPYDRD